MEHPLEVSGSRRFTLAEIRGKVAESKKFWNSPEGKRTAAARAKKRPPPFDPARCPRQKALAALKRSATLTH